MTVTPWPNGLGLDVNLGVGLDAEIWKQDDGLAVHVLAGDQIKSLYIPDPTIDLVEAVRRCCQEGKLVTAEPAQE